MSRSLATLKHNTKERISNSRVIKKITNSKFLKRFAFAFLAMGGYSRYAFAEPSQDGYTMIANTIDMATTWIRYLGAIVFIYGLVAFIMAWKSHNSEGQSNAGMWLVVGAMLLAIKTIVSAIGVI